MNILQLLASDNYIAVNKDLIKILNLEGAVVFGELASEYIYWDKEGKIEDGYFYSTIENIQEKTSLSAYQQRQALKVLEQNELINIKFKGIPPKRYIKINEEQLVKLFNLQMLKNLTYKDEKILSMNVKKFNTNNNINNKNIIKEEEIYKEICERVISRLNELNGSRYSTTSDSNVKLIKKLIKEHKTEEELMLVVEKMSYIWNQPSKKDMTIYLRPSTLFRPSNFDEYLNMPVRQRKITTKDLAKNMDFTDFLNEGKKKNE